MENGTLKILTSPNAHIKWQHRVFLNGRKNFLPTSHNFPSSCLFKPHISLEMIPRNLYSSPIWKAAWWTNLNPKLGLAHFITIIRITHIGGVPCTDCSHWKRIGVNSQFHTPMPILWSWFLEFPNSNSTDGIGRSTQTPIMELRMLNSVCVEDFRISRLLIQALYTRV